VSRASENLRDNQEQADMDGCMVKVSRQAIEETLTQHADMLAVLRLIAKGFKQKAIPDQTILNTASDGASMDMTPLSKIVADAVAKAG
jgi:hypothetical protein